MPGKKQDEQGEQQELLDLDLGEEQAEGVTGGLTLDVAMQPGPVPVPVPYPNQGLSGEPTRRKS
jgi:hypothetical protein